MTTYNYFEAMKTDIYRELTDSFDYLLSDYTAEDFADNLDDIEEKLHESFWIDDGITGNASGSYTFSSYTAKEYVTDNTDLCAEACREFCMEAEEIADKFLSEEWEYFDVTIRCYILGQVLAEVLEEIADAIEEAQAEEIENIIISLAA